MKQPPVADFQEDREAPLHHGRSGWRAYLVALPVVAALAVVALLGVTGSKVAPDDKTRPSELAGLTTPANFSRPTGLVGDPIYIPGLQIIRVSDSAAVTAGLPPDTLPLDADGGDFLYASQPGLFVWVSDQATQYWIDVATARPCGQIAQASLSGTDVIYSEIVPAGYSGDGDAGCPDFGDAVDWYVSITDFTSRTRQVASGTYMLPTGTAAAAAAPRVAIADAIYGFSRPDKTGQAAVVEVHRLVDDTLQYKSVALALPDQIRLGDGRLVVVSSGPAPSGSLDGTLSVWSTTDWSEPLSAVSSTSGPIALSRHGQRLVFAGCEKDGDKLNCDSLDTIAPGVYWAMQLPSAATFVSVDSSLNSRFDATAWISSTSDGRTYIGVATLLGNTAIALVGMDPPIWISIQDDALLWLSVAPDGSPTLTRLDLASVLPAS